MKLYKGTGTVPLVLCTSVQHTMEALQIYRNKDVVENSFDDLKSNRYDDCRARILLQWMADCLSVSSLGVYCIARKMRVKSWKTMLSENADEMDTLTKITYSGKCSSIISEATKKRIIMEALSRV